MKNNVNSIIAQIVILFAGVFWKDDTPAESPSKVEKLYNVFFYIALSSALCVIAVSCSAGGSAYNFDFPFSNARVYSSDSSYGVAVPAGWYQVEDNECNCNNILLMRAGLEASLNLIPVNMDNVSSGRIEKNPLTQLMKYSKIMNAQKSGAPLNVVEEENFSVGEIPVQAYKYINSKGFEQRVLLFSVGNKYFELSGNSATKKKDILQDLFSAQNSLIKQIVFYL